MKKITFPIESSEEDTVSPLHPDLWWFVKMLIVIIIAIIFAVWGSYTFSRVLLSRIDLATEREYFWDMMIDETMKPFDLTSLQTLGITGALSGYNIYLQDSQEANAFATLGGNIIVTSALLENIKNEEELIFILGHERAHIENRDVIQSFAQSMPIILTLQSLWIDTGNSITSISSILGNYASREKESFADDSGIIFLKSLGLNSACATGFFEQNKNGFESYVEIFSSHPVSWDRLRKLEEKKLSTEKICTPMSTYKSKK